MGSPVEANPRWTGTQRVERSYRPKHRGLNRNVKPVAFCYLCIVLQIGQHVSYPTGPVFGNRPMDPRNRADLCICAAPPADSLLAVPDD